MKIVLISCVKGKNESRSLAKDLYKGPLFKNSLCVAKSLQTDESKIFILSAKHHLLGLNTMIDPYEMTLKTFSNKEKSDWGKKVIQELKKVSNIDTDEFIILAGKEYFNPISEIENKVDYLGALNYGKRTAYLKSKCNESKQ